MTISMFLWYIGLGFALFALAMFTLIERRWVRLFLSTTVFLASLVLIWIGLFSLTGVPQPIWLMVEKPKVETAVVLGGDVVEDVGIFILLQAPELGPIPRYLWFPYSKQAAEKFQKAQRAGRQRAQDGGDERFTMRNPFEFSLDEREDEFFHPMPQPKMPDKPRTDRELRIE